MKQISAKIWIASAAVLFAVVVMTFVLIFLNDNSGVGSSSTGIESGESVSSNEQGEENKIDIYTENEKDEDSANDGEDKSADTASKEDDVITFVSDYRQSEDYGARLDLGNDMTLISFGSYSGEFIEDGSNDRIENAVAAVIRNDGDEDIQYAEISVETANTTYVFSVSTIPKGEIIFALDKNKATVSDDMTVISASSKSVAYFLDEMSVHSDTFAITGVDNALYIENLTDTDITEDVGIYYKAVKEGQYFGGVTYRVIAEGGVPAHEKVCISSNHFKVDSSRVMFVEYGQ